MARKRKQNSGGDAATRNGSANPVSARALAASAPAASAPRTSIEARPSAEKHAAGDAQPLARRTSPTAAAVPATASPKSPSIVPAIAAANTFTDSPVKAAANGAPLSEAVSLRAHQIWIARGRPTPGTPLEDWLQAERELRAART